MFQHTDAVSDEDSEMTVYIDAAASRRRARAIGLSATCEAGSRGVEWRRGRRSGDCVALNQLEDIQRCVAIDKGHGSLVGLATSGAARHGLKR